MKVCRRIAFYRFWAIIFPTFGGLGGVLGSSWSWPRLRPQSPSPTATGLCWVAGYLGV